MDALAALLDGLGDGAVGPGAFQQFDLVGAYLEERRDHPFALHRLTFVRCYAEQLGVGLFGFSQVVHGDAEVFDTDHAQG
jgi:hypothetical protein